MSLLMRGFFLSQLSVDVRRGSAHLRWVQCFQMISFLSCMPIHLCVPGLARSSITRQSVKYWLAYAV